MSTNRIRISIFGRKYSNILEYSFKHWLKFEGIFVALPIWYWKPSNKYRFIHNDQLWFFQGFCLDIFPRRFPKNSIYWLDGWFSLRKNFKAQASQYVLQMKMHLLLFNSNARISYLCMTTVGYDLENQKTLL